MSESVSIRMLSGVAEQNLARRIFDEVWPTDEGTQITANLLQALVHNGTYISGAFMGDEIVAAAFAFPGRDSHGHFHLHSHMAAVKEQFRNLGIGSQIKWHQRAWAMENGYDTITWTFDPLVRRNAKLNLVKLGAQVFEYFPDFKSWSSYRSKIYITSFRYDARKSYERVRFTWENTFNSDVQDGDRFVLIE